MSRRIKKGHLRGELRWSPGVRGSSSSWIRPSQRMCWAQAQVHPAAASPPFVLSVSSHWICARLFGMPSHSNSWTSPGTVKTEPWSETRRSGVCYCRSSVTSISSSISELWTYKDWHIYLSRKWSRQWNSSNKVKHFIIIHTGYVPVGLLWV